MLSLEIDEAQEFVDRIIVFFVCKIQAKDCIFNKCQNIFYILKILLYLSIRSVKMKNDVRNVMAILLRLIVHLLDILSFVFSP